jgi:1,4-alpha-glucan branching enzyme
VCLPRGEDDRGEETIFMTNSKDTRIPTREIQNPLVRYEPSLLSEDDLYLFNEGTHYRLHDKLGAHPMTVEGVDGTYFAVWAPNAREVAVIGELAFSGNPI